MDAGLLEILVCPSCKGKLVHNRDANELVCRGERLAYPVRDGVPVMLVDEARTITEDEL